MKTDHHTRKIDSLLRYLVAGRVSSDRQYKEESRSYRQASEARVALSNRLPAGDTADSSYDDYMRAAREDWLRKNCPQSRDVSFNPDFPQRSSNAPPRIVYSSQANLSHDPTPFWASVEQQGQFQNIERGLEHRSGTGYDSSSPMLGQQRSQSDRGSDNSTVIRPAHNYGLRSRKFDGSSDQMSF